MTHTLALLLYYGFARYLPSQPAPEWRSGYDAAGSMGQTRRGRR